MNLNFSIQIKGLNRQKNELKEQSNKVLFLSMSKILEIAKRKAPVDTGNLRSSINMYPKTPNSKEYTITDGVDYGIHLEFGTSPHHPPTSSLKGWAGRVLGDPNAAYAVANAISKRGTPAQPFFRPAVQEVKDIWIDKFSQNINA